MARSREGAARLTRARARLRQSIAFNRQDVETNEAGWELMVQLAAFARARDRSVDPVPRRVKISDDHARAMVAYIRSIEARIPE